ncbi:glycosyl transferase [Oenococcus sicerae]|uniref:Glycosyl transferase n=1 Tax=Oenococcus sicerae TaxID=2203724 RepID=A0ABX5QKU4_9LACO|nr:MULTISPECIES: capsular polysaccharide synthesis protein [Oenococcus]QAS69337.2 glycosyl transferase [Oenococcus sicerae]SYW14867.1 Capsular polysaccharide synthesis protein [Oenococcus oeni]
MKQQFDLKQQLKSKGIGFLKDLLFSHTFFYTAFSVALNGFSKTSLELVQMGKRNKIKGRYAKKYANILQQELTSSSIPSSSTKIVWTCWVQGEEQAPQIVRKALSSIKHAFKDYEVVVIDHENLGKYVNLPVYILSKWKDGRIPNAHFSDIIRAYLLSRYGGIWIDATVMVHHLPKNYTYLLNQELFFYQNLRPGQSGNAVWLSSWLIIAKKGEPTISRLYEMLLSYWRTHNHLQDYYLFHIFWHLILEKNPSILKNMPKIPNSLPLLLMYRLRDDNNLAVIDEAFASYPIQKITYKDMSSKGTIFGYLEEHGITDESDVV